MHGLIFIRLLVLAQAKLPVKLVNTSAGVYQLLFACIKRVALGANLHSDIFPCATRLNNLSACTLDSRLLIIWMDSFFHCLSRADKLDFHLPFALAYEMYIGYVTFIAYATYARDFIIAGQ